jgi:hypothetical protein
VVGGTAVATSEGRVAIAKTGRVTDTGSCVGKQPSKLNKKKQISKNLVRIRKKGEGWLWPSPSKF